MQITELKGLKLSKKEEKMVYLFNHGVDPQDIQESLGIVYGLCVYSRSFMMDKLARIKDFVGGKVGTYEKLVREAIEGAKADLAKRAEELGANAVVNVTIELVPTALIKEGTQVCALVYGTAVRLRPEVL